MDKDYELIESLLNGSRQTSLESRQDQVKLENEINAIHKSMTALPTARESEALPDLQVLLKHSHNLVNKPDHPLNSLLHKDDTLRRVIVFQLFEYVAYSVIKARIYNNKEIVRVADRLFCNLVVWSTRQLGRYQKEYLSLLNTIINKGADYYKSNGKESINVFPFGEQLDVSDELKEWVDGLQEGDEVDCLKNYGGRKIWSRGKILSNEYNLVKVRFSNDNYDSYIQNKYFELAQLGTREQDFDWRENISEGDEVDYYNIRKDWKRYKVLEIEIEENSYDEDVRLLKLKKTEDQENEYDFDSTISVRAQSPAVAPPGKYSNRGEGIDDSDDEIFLSMINTDKFAIMRNNSIYSTSSIYLIKYINLFGENGGFDRLLNILEDNSDEARTVLSEYIRLIQSSSDYLVAPFIKENGEKMLNKIKEYIMVNTQMNLRDLSQSNLIAVLEGINCLSQRIYPTDVAKKLSDNLKLNIAILCIKSEFLEKQFFGAKVIGDIEQKLRTHDCDFSKADLAKQLYEAEVFEIIVKGHSSLVGKSSGVLNILFTENMVNSEQLEFLWKEIGKTDVDSRNSLLGVLKDVIWNFSQEEIKFFVKAIKNNFEVLNDNEVFELLFALKRVSWNRHSDMEVLNSVNEILWTVLQSNSNLKEDLKKEVIKNFIKCLIDDAEKEENVDIEENKPENPTPQKSYITRMIDNIINRENFQINLKILYKFMKEENILVLKIMEELKERNVLSNILEEIIKHLKTPTRLNLKDLKKKIKFINQVTNSNGGKDLLSFEEMEKVWKVMIENDIHEEVITNWINTYLKNKQTEGDEFIRFFRKYIKEIIKPGKETYFKFIMQIFIKINNTKGNIDLVELKLETIGMTSYRNKKINRMRLKVPVKELEGFDDIWNLFIETENVVLEKKIAAYLVMISVKQEFLTDVDNELYLQEYENLYNKCLEMFLSNNSNLNRKSAAIMELMMKKEEQSGFGNLNSFSSLKEGEKIILDVEKNTKYFREKFKIQLTTNSTLRDIREKIVDEYRMAFDVISIQVNNTDGRSLDYNDNSKTIDELGLRMRDLLIVTEREMPEVVGKPLLNTARDNFSKDAMAVFKEIFASYSFNEKMKKVDLARFTSAATDGAHCGPNDDRVVGIFNKYDTENRGYVTFEDFHDFYLSCAVQSDSKASTVRQNLLSLGYGKGLELKKNRITTANENSLRSKLMNNEEFGKKILERIGSEDLSEIEENFIEFVTPPIEYIKKIVADPLTELNRCIGNTKMLNYYTVILNAVTFRKNEFAIFSMEEEESKESIKKIFSKQFIDSLINKLTIMDVSEKSYLQIKFMEKVIRILTQTKQETFIVDTNNFIAYFVKKKKKDNLTNSNKKVKDSSTQNDRVEIGPENKKDKEKEKEEEEVPEVKNLKNIFELIGKESLEKIIAELDFRKINTTFINFIIEQIENKTDTMKFHKLMLSPGIICLLGSLLLNPEELNTLFAFKKSTFKIVLIKGLAHDKTMTRLFFKNFYSYLTSAISDINHKTAFLRLVIDSLKNDNLSEAHALLELASSMLSELSFIKLNSNPEEAKRLHKEFDFSSLFKDFSVKLRNTESKEVSYESKEDTGLSAILIFMEKLLKTDDYILKEMTQLEREKLAEYILKNCLFDISPGKLNFKSIKCKSQKSRSAALELLKELTNDNTKTIIRLMASGFDALSTYCPSFGQGNSTSSINKKSSFGYVGIRNPGCVCYMNAMLQQFYCTPAFRYTILLGNDKKEPEIATIKEGYQIDDNVFHQLQRMFAFLDHSERYAYHPSDFCSSYKDYTGQRVNIMVQQDAQEFLNMIFQKIEEAIKPTPYFGMLNSVFAGKTCNVFTCKGCGFVRSNEEMFYNLSLEVKNLENINESLNKFISQETISDFMCDNCKNKCDVTKQCFLKELPNVLVIHLQKIIFDMETLMNIKISSKFEFKHKMNLQDFVYKEKAKENEKKDGEDDQTEPEVEEEEKDPEDFEYKLVGVVIHRGNAEYGHYTSLININRNDPSRDTKEDTWLDFDDSRVTKFNMDNFEEECFGSEDKETATAYPSLDHNISKSAYILVYDKVKKTDIVFTVDKDHKDELDRIKSALIDKTKITNEGDEYRTPFFNMGRFIPKHYFDEVDIDNNSLILEQQLLSSKFCNSFAEIVSNNDFPVISDNYQLSDVPNKYHETLANMNIKILPRFVFKIYCASNDNYRIGKVLKTIETSLVIQKDNSFYFFLENIVQNMDYLFSLLINNTDSLVRNAVSEFFVFSILIMAERFDLKLNLTEEIDYENADIQTQANYKLQFVLYKFIHLIPAANPNSSDYRKMSAFFLTLKRIIERNTHIAVFMFRSNVLKMLYDLYNCQEPSRISTHEKSLTNVLSCINTLLRMQKGFEEQGMDLNPNFDYYKSIMFLEKIMKEDYRFDNYEALKKLITLFCTDNYNLTETIAKLALNGLAMSPDVDSIAYLECIKALVLIDDEYSFKRLPLILGFPRLSDCKMQNTDGDFFMYGLAKENSLKKSVYCYKSSFDLERGMIEELNRVLNINESCALLIIFYILDMANEKEAVLDYLIESPMTNYISNNVVDFYRNFVRTQLASFQNSYSAPKAELQCYYFSNLEEKMKLFERRFRKRVIELNKNKGVEIKEEDIVVFGDDTKKPSYSLRTNYMIGKTISCKKIKQINLMGDDKPLYINISLVRVSLMENSANGVKNLVIPEDVMAYDSYINKRSLESKEFELFIGNDDDIIIEDDANEYNLKSLIDEDEPEPTQEKPKMVRKFSEDIPEGYNFINSDYILRISVENKTNEHYFMKFLITGNDCVKGEEIMLPVKMKKLNTLVHNLYKRDPEGTFDGVGISVKFCETESYHARYYAEEECGEYVEVYKHE